MSTLFQKIHSGEIPSEIVHQDEFCCAFHDTTPQAPVHILITPRDPIPRIAAASLENASLLGHLLLTAAKIARDFNVEDSGYRIIINNGPHGGESVPHLHLHLLAGRQLDWPPG